MATKKCPVCGVAVKVENLERHVRNQHPKAQVDSTALLTEEEKEEVKEAKATSRPGLTRTGKRMLAIVAVVLVAIIVIAVVLSVWHPPGIGVGQTAPNFTLTSSTGTSTSLNEFRGRPVLLEFMNTRCPACNNEAPILASLYQSFSGRTYFLSVDIAIAGDLAINTPAEIESFKSQYNTVWTYVIDSQGTVSKLYNVYATPTIYILDANGVVAHVPEYNLGQDSYSSLSGYLNATLG